MGERTRNWSVTVWRRVIFSDESKINLFKSDGIPYGRRRSWKSAFTELFAREGGRRMIWGCFSYHGVGQLALIVLPPMQNTIPRIQ